MAFIDVLEVLLVAVLDYFKKDAEGIQTYFLLR